MQLGLLAEDLSETGLHDVRVWVEDPQPTGLYLAGLDLAGARLMGTQDARYLRGLDFGGADLRGVTFDTVDLTGARFAGAILKDTSFRQVTCSDGKRSREGVTGPKACREPPQRRDAQGPSRWAFRSAALGAARQRGGATWSASSWVNPAKPRGVWRNSTRMPSGSIMYTARPPLLGPMLGVTGGLTEVTPLAVSSA